MFKSFNVMLTNLFTGAGNLTKSFENLTTITVIYSEEAMMTAKLESSAGLRSLQKQLEELPE